MKNLKLYITESIEELFHFTNIGNIINICRSDEFHFSSDDGMNYGYKYYMSTTRQRNALTGYAKNMNDRKIVRLVLDADLLKSKFKIKPVDYNNRASHWAIRDNWSDKKAFDDNYKSIMEQPSVENEDRILTNKETLNDFHKYIKEILVDLMSLNQSDIKDIEKYCNKFDIVFTIMNRKQFEIGKIKYK